MLTVKVELLHGVMRAGSPEDVVLAGQEDSGEWPPSPARLFSAFVAADGTGDRTHVTDGTELRVLETPPDRIHADRAGDVHVSTQRLRFVPIDETDARGRTVQEYVARNAAGVRSAPRISPRAPTITYVWEDADPDDGAMRALELRAARIGYLGTADSPTRVSVSKSAPSEESCWILDPSGGVTLPAPEPGTIEMLDAAFTAWSGGQPVRRATIPIPRRRYRSPDDPLPSAQADPTVVWLRFDGSISGRKALLVAETLRAAMLERLSATLGEEGIPTIVHGHGTDDRGRHQVYWTPLPNAAHRYSDGRIRGAAVWIPPEADGHLVEAIRAAAGSIQELIRPDAFSVKMRPHTGELRPWSVHPDHWCRPSRLFVTVLPAVHERWGKRPPDRGEVGRWCRHAGLPEPERVHLSKVPMLPGAVQLAPSETRRPGREWRPFSHVTVAFPEPIRGPVVIGRMRQFGLGLCLPVHRDPSPV